VLTATDFKWSGFAVFDARTARQIPWRKRVSGDMSTFTASGNTVYLGSSYANNGARLYGRGFSKVGGKPVNNLASVMLPEGKFTNWRPNAGRCTEVSSMAASGRKLLAVGRFSPRPCSY